MNFIVMLWRNIFFLYFVTGSVLLAQSVGWNGNMTPKTQENQGETVSAVSEGVRFYLLRTGFLAEGTATNDGKQYVIRTNFGTMSIPIANVEFAGQTREDVYRYKKGFTDSRNCNELMKLAEWCFSNQLQQQGITEYQQALAAAPNAVLADIIQKRLETVKNPNSESRGLSGVMAVPRGYGSEADAGQGQGINGIPKPILETFSKKVQPVLVSRCAAANCHGSNSSNEFKLNIPNHTLGNATYRNLRSVIQWIDLDYPTESQLLSALVAYHGGAKPAFSVESPQYHNIVQWVQSAAKELPEEYRVLALSQSKTAPSKNKKTTGNLPPPLRKAIADHSPTEKKEKETHQKMPATFLSSTKTDTKSAANTVTNTTLPTNYSPTSLNVPLNIPSPVLTKTPDDHPLLPSSSPPDPLDPQIFNTRYHGIPKR